MSDQLLEQLDDRAKVATAENRLYSLPPV